MRDSKDRCDRGRVPESSVKASKELLCIECPAGAEHRAKGFTATVTCNPGTVLLYGWSD